MGFWHFKFYDVELVSKKLTHSISVLQNTKPITIRGTQHTLPKT